MRLGTIAPEGTAWIGACFEPFGRHLAKVTNDKVRLKSFVGATLGDEATHIKLMQLGELHAYGGSLGALARAVPELDAFELPYLFESEAEVDAVYASPAGAEARRIARDAGFEIALLAEVGWRHFAGRKPLRTAADFTGLPARSQESPLHVEMWRQLGTRPQPLPVTSTLAALETGAVQLLDQSPIFLFATSWYRQTPFYSLSHHIYQPGILVLSRKLLASQPPAVQRTLGAFRAATEAECLAAIRAEGRSVLDHLRRELKVVELTAAERAALRERMAPVHALFRKTTTPAGRALLDRIQAALAAFRARK